MNKKNCKEALEVYKKFLARMDSVKEFLKVAEVGKIIGLRLYLYSLCTCILEIVIKSLNFIASFI